MEQCSSEEAAKYKAGLVPDGSAMVDLTGGFGVDFAILSKKFASADYVERQEVLVKTAEWNFNKLQLSGVALHLAESSEFVTNNGSYDLIYIDPARRGDHNEKVVRLEDCEPNVVEMLPELLNKSEHVMIKTSPLLDIKGAIRSLKSVDEVHVLAIGNEVKELIFLLSSEGSDLPKIHCANLQHDKHYSFSFDFQSEEGSSSSFNGLMNYLYEPNAAILKAGAFKCIGNEFGLNKLHSNTHLYTSSELVKDFPGRTFLVKDKITLNKKALKAHFPEMKANITVRNFPMTVAQIRKKSGLKEGGNQYLFGTTDQDGKQLVLCEKVDS